MDKEIVKQLELSLLQPEVRKSREKLDKLVSDDFIEIGSSGKIFDKKHVLEDLPEMEAPKFLINSFETKELAPDLIMTIFQISKTLANQTTLSQRSSVWKKNNGNWQMIFHQGTIIK